ncbi:MAG: protoporphyrinogen oxidase [Acidiferrobacterales bacterium]
MNDVDVLIAGGGISGLATAWWLAQQGLTVELWERDSRPGGKIHSDEEGGYLTERAATLVMNFRPEVNRFVMSCDIAGDKVLPRPVPNRYLLHEGRLVTVPMKLGAMVSSPLWSLRGKLRLLAEPFILKGGHEEETVSQFITRRLGAEVLERAMEPYVAGVLASDPQRANAYAVLPRLTALERRYGSLALGVFVHRLARWRRGCPTESFSFRGGMSTLVETLATARGVRLRLDQKVEAIALDGTGSWRVSGRCTQGERTLKAAHVVLSVPADAAASLVTPLDTELAKLLCDIDYAPISVVHVGFDRSAVQHPLDGTGFLVPRREHSMLNGNLWVSTLFPDRAPPGKVLFSNYLGGVRSPQAAEWDDARSVDTVMQMLSPLLGIGAAPEMVRIDRHQRALPLYHGAYCGLGRAIDGRLRRWPGLHLEANYLGGVSIRDRIICANNTAKRILLAIGHSSPRAAAGLEGRGLGLEPGA